MDYEKKYKEALELARVAAFNGHQSLMEGIFPELKESEDEKIRKTIVRFFKDNYPNETEMYDGSVTVGKAIAWLENIPYTIDHEKREGFHLGYKAGLEKQELKSNPYSGVSFSYNGNIWGMCARDNGVEILFDGELKAFLSSEKSFIYPTRPQPVLEPIKEEKAGNNNKVETKFKVGDWVVNTVGDTNQVVKVLDDGYTLDDNTFISNSWTTEHYHLWSIADAKEGDVLFMDNGSANCIFIYKSSKNGIINKYASYNNFGFEGEHYLVLNDGYVIPATKEQRDLLFQKMNEAGYEWDAEKKELRKIDARKNITLDGDLMEADCMIVEQKPTWSEKDEKEYKYVLKFVDNILNNCGNKKDYEHCKRCYDWLKSLRPQPKQEWSEEDEKIFVNLISYGSLKYTGEQVIDWLKSLRQRIGG